jgi:hypothetical protein
MKWILGDSLSDDDDDSSSDDRRPSPLIGLIKKENNGF